MLHVQYSHLRKYTAKRDEYRALKDNPPRWADINPALVYAVCPHKPTPSAQILQASQRAWRNLANMVTIAGRDSMELPGQLPRNAPNVRSQKLPPTFMLNARPSAFPAYESESKLTRPEPLRLSRDPPSLNGNVCSSRTNMRLLARWWSTCLKNL